ncbi:endonuclease NucS domain-containing protein [Nitrosopumilus sp.]|uniref:endonuclease NucS domain-containing protein n=1 Tax=Nitrosopumilus sp. TaxID=2024843 RepID=UPI003D11506C
MQAEMGVAVLMAIIVAIIISAIFYGIQRRGIASIQKKLQPLSNLDPKIVYDVSRIDTELKTAYSDLTNLKTNLPHTNEITSLEENIKKLCLDFTELKTNIDDQMNKFRLNTTEDLDKTKDEMIKTATQKITEQTTNHLTETSVSREEFESLKERISKMLGADEVAERMEILSLLFDSSQIKTLNWQCKLIKLLNGGLAPDAEEDLIVAEGIPKSRCEKFLKTLTAAGITEAKKVSAYYLAPDYEWIYSYVDNPDWLQNRLSSNIKKEYEYQQYIKNNLHLIEEGLLLEKSEYELATGKIDFICRDSNGKAVGLELKYPSATKSVKRQISGYKNDYESKSGRTDSRFFVIAPKIPEDLKTLLVSDGFEYREIEF